MLSDRFVNHLKNKKWWSDDVADEYKNALSALGVDMSSDFAQFYLHAEDGPTFSSKNREIYQICWFLINSTGKGVANKPSSLRA